MFHQNLEIKFRKDSNSNFDVYSEKVRQPIFNTDCDYFSVLKNFDLKVEIVERFISFYKKTLYNMNMSDIVTDSYDLFGMIHYPYIKYIENNINFNSYIDIINNRYLMIYKFKQRKPMKTVVNNFQIIFEFKDFNTEPEILIFPKWENPVTSYDNICNIIFNNLLDVFIYTNKINNIDYKIPYDSDKYFFDSIVTINNMYNI